MLLVFLVSVSRLIAKIFISLETRRYLPGPARIAERFLLVLLVCVVVVHTLKEILS